MSQTPDHLSPNERCSSPIEKQADGPISKMLRAGYFEFDGRLARRQKDHQKAQLWEDGIWVNVPNYAQFLLLARPIDVTQAEKMAREEGVVEF